MKWTPTLTSLEGNAAEVQADAQDKARKVLAELRKTRDGFRDAIKKQTGANEAAWTSAKTRLETECYGKQFELQQATFKLQAAAQLKAWRDAADKLASAGSEFASRRRDEIETNVNRMKADACASEENLLKLSRAGSQSWSALAAALTETRAVFDRANQAAWEAFKRAHLNKDNRPNYGEIAAWRSLHIIYAPMRQHVLI